MKKVLVLSYYFPPCNLTPASRVLAWAKHLHEFGYYPVIVTRRWDRPIAKIEDVYLPSEGDIQVIKHEHYEVHHLPYRQNFRDILLTRYGSGKFRILRKALTLFELFFQNFTNLVIPYRNMYRYTSDLIAADSSLNKLIISGNPFIQFRFGYLLNKYHGVKWIADYRDAWTTSEISYVNTGRLTNLLRKLEALSEKKWIGTASKVSVVTEPILKKIESFTGRSGRVLINGFVKQEFDSFRHLPKYDRFTISYVGALYTEQKIELFISSFKKFIDANPESGALLKFIGTAYQSEQKQRLDQLLKGYETHYECTDRMERTKILEAESRSHLLLYAAWEGFSGVIGSKVYEYMASGTYSIITPSDKGIVEETMKISGAGTCTSTIDETVSFLQSAFEKYQKKSVLNVDVNNPRMHRYSREEQVKILAEMLNEI